MNTGIASSYHKFDLESGAIRFATQIATTLAIAWGLATANF
jgi:hypothetical protein